MNNENSDKLNKTSEEETDNSPDISDIIESLPSSMRREIKRETLMMASFMQGSPDSALAQKMTPEHITAFINDAGENMRLGYKDLNRTRIFYGIVLFLVLAFVGFIVLVFRDNPNMVENIIYAFIGLAAGGACGYGIGKFKS